MITDRWALQIGATLGLATLLSLAGGLLTIL
jgi:hypothetical protein